MKKLNHKASLAREIFDYTKWWIIVLGVSPCKCVFCNPHINIFQLDAFSKSAGYTYNEDWGYVDWQCDLLHLSNVHINVKETITTVLPARRWATLWKDSKVLFCTDNKTGKAIIIKGFCMDYHLLP